MLHHRVRNHQRHICLKKPKSWYQQQRLSLTPFAERTDPCDAAIAPTMFSARWHSRAWSAAEGSTPISDVTASACATSMAASSDSPYRGGTSPSRSKLKPGMRSSTGQNHEPATPGVPLQSLPPCLRKARVIFEEHQRLVVAGHRSQPEETNRGLAMTNPSRCRSTLQRREFRVCC